MGIRSNGAPHGSGARENKLIPRTAPQCSAGPGVFLYLVPRSGSRFLWGNVQGRAIKNQFHAGNAYFRRDIDS